MSSPANGNGLSISQVGLVSRFYPDGKTPDNSRPANEDPNAIDAQDCQQDILLQFTLALGGLPTEDSLSVWAGTTDCSKLSARSESGGGPYCWPLPATFGSSLTSTGNIAARDIIRYLASTEAVNDLVPVSSTPGPQVCQPLGPVSGCPVPITLYFMFINPDGITVDASLAYPQPVYVSPGSTP